MDYTQLVLVRHEEKGKVYLFEAPVKADINDGDVLIVKTRNGKITYGISVGRIYVKRCSPAYRFVLSSTDAFEPLCQVIGKYEEIKF